MRNNFLVLATVVLGTLSVTLAFDRPNMQQHVETTSAPGHIGENTLPDFTLSLLNGKKLRLHDFKGKVLLLNLWASWCVPCLQEFPHLIELARSAPDEIALVAVSVDDGPEDVRRFLIKTATPVLPDNVFVARDEGGIVRQRIFNTTRLPETIIVAPDLTMTRKIIGADVDWNGPEMRGYLMGLNDL